MFFLSFDASTGRLRLVKLLALGVSCLPGLARLQKNSNKNGLSSYEVCVGNPRSEENILESRSFLAHFMNP